MYACLDNYILTSKSTKMFCTENCGDVLTQYLTLIQSFIFSNDLRDSTLSNSGVLKCSNKDSPTSYFYKTMYA